MSYLLVALHRGRRRQDFHTLLRIFFKMIDSFAQYGRSEAQDTIDRLLRVSWFKTHKRDVYHLIASYNRVIAGMFGAEKGSGTTKGSGVFCAQHPSGRSGKRLLTPLLPHPSGRPGKRPPTPFPPPSISVQKQVIRDVQEFVETYKVLTNYDAKDEARINELVDNPGLMDEMLEKVYQSLG